MTALVERTPWPRRLWAPARIRYATSLSPDEIVARLADQSQGCAAPRHGNLSKIGYRTGVTLRGFKLFKVAGRFLGNPPRTIAVLDATTSQTGAGTVINGEVRLPYPYLLDTLSYFEDAEGHVAIRPLDDSRLAQWATSRGTWDDPLTTEAFRSVVDTY